MSASEKKFVCSQMVEREMSEKTERTPASGSRTLLRLMWGCQFIRVLLKELGANETLTAKVSSVLPSFLWLSRTHRLAWWWL